MLVERDVLVAEEDHAVLGERSMDLVLLTVGQGLSEVNAADLCADLSIPILSSPRLGLEAALQIYWAFPSP